MRLWNEKLSDCSPESPTVNLLVAKLPCLHSSKPIGHEQARQDAEACSRQSNALNVDFLPRG